jgi:hypothetical protein
VKKLKGTHMIRAKKQKRQQCCDVAKVIDTVEKAASTAVRVYKAVKPIATAILTNGRKTK